MGIFHERVETEENITITYKYHALFYILMALFVVASIFMPMIAGEVAGQFCLVPLIAGLFFIMVAIYFIDIWKPNAETRKAMKNGSVTVSGSKFSFSNPMKVVIKKSLNE